MIIIFFVTACSDDQQLNIELGEKATSINWVTRNYRLESGYGNYFENWEKADSNTYYGLGYFMDIEYRYFI